MRNAFIYALTTLSFATIGCSKTVVNLDGQINGKKVNGAAHWGGPYIVFTDSDLGCQELSWVESSYGTSDEYEMTNTDENFAALQIYYTSSNVVEGEAAIPPNSATFIEADDGTATITSKFTAPEPTGNIDIEFDGDDWIIGEMSIDFGEAGKITGNFEIQKCVNLKSAP